jgi:hypothetical protein
MCLKQTHVEVKWSIYRHQAGAAEAWQAKHFNGNSINRQSPKQQRREEK